MNLYLTKAGRLRRKDNTLRFEAVNLPEEPDPEIEHDDLDSLDAAAANALPAESIDAVYIFGEVTLNTKLINFLNQRRIPVHIFNWYGYHTGTILPHAEQLSGDLVIRQAEAFRDPAERMTICRNLLKAAFHNIRMILQYYQRRKGGLDKPNAEIAALENQLAACGAPETLMGLEGNVRRIYYRCWSVWMGDCAANFKRVYHPPDNPLNALLSFLNSLLYTACVSELYRTALYPGISYLHTPQTRRFSLALDVVEPFKPVMVDRFLFRLFDCKMISDKDFRKYSNGFILTGDARRKVLREWDAELRQTLFCRNLNRSVSYRQLLRLDCYKLINFLLEERPYEPYKMDA